MPTLSIIKQDSILLGKFIFPIMEMHMKIIHVSVKTLLYPVVVSYRIHKKLEKREF